MPSLQEFSGTLGIRLAAHLLRRCSFRQTKQQIDALAGMTAGTAVDSLFADIPVPIIDEPIDFETGQPFINSGVPAVSSTTNQRAFIKGWWMNEALNDPTIGHKMMFFLHTTFTTSLQSAYPLPTAFDHIQLLKFYAYGNFKEFAKKMSVDNHMLRYLDGRNNTNTSPNENYGREFLELFSIGKGPQLGPGDYTNYTEDDIVTAARLFSGWYTSDRTLPANQNYIDADCGIQLGYPIYSRHDTADKTFSASAFGGQTITGAIDANDMYRELNDFVEMVYGQQETARNFCRRLYRFFVSDKITPEVESDIIEPLSVEFYNNNYEIVPTVKHLLKSEHFFDKDDANPNDQIIGRLIKSPLDKVMHILSYFEIPLPDIHTNTREHYYEFYRRSLMDTLLSYSGMDVFEPDSVAGYPAYYQEPGYTKNWISASTITTRYKYPEMFLTGNRLLVGGDLADGVILDMVNWLQTSGIISNPFNAHTIVTELTQYLFPEVPDAERLDYFLNDIFLDHAPAFDWTEDWVTYLNNGDPAPVKIPLDNLLKAVIYSQDFQLM